AYLEMAARGSLAFDNEASFMTYAARVMRGVIIDHARRNCALKRGGFFQIASVENIPAQNPLDHAELVRLSDALDELAQVEPDLTEVVDLKFFCGFSFSEIAAMRGLSERTVQ